MQPPIYQCSNGHCLCGSCHECLFRCNTCQVVLNQMSPIRTRVLEDALISANVHFPCRFQHLGCRAQRSCGPEKDNHELNCPYRPVSCPHCYVNPSLWNLVAHWKHYHNTKWCEGQPIASAAGSAYVAALNWNVSLVAPFHTSPPMMVEDNCIFESKQSGVDGSLHLYCRHVAKPFHYRISVKLFETKSTFMYSGPSRVIDEEGDYEATRRLELFVPLEALVELAVCRAGSLDQARVEINLKVAPL